MTSLTKHVLICLSIHLVIHVLTEGLGRPLERPQPENITMPQNSLHRRTATLDFTCLNGIRAQLPITRVASVIPAPRSHIPGRSFIIDDKGHTWLACEDPDDLQLSMTILLHQATTFTPFN